MFLSTLSKRTSLTPNLTHSRTFNHITSRTTPHRHYALVFAPKHVYPKNWATFKVFLNVEYLELKSAKFHKYLGVDTSETKAENLQNFDDLEYYEGEAKNPKVMIQEFFNEERIERARQLNCKELTPLQTDCMLRALFYNMSTRYMPELAAQTEPFFHPLTVPLWLMSNDPKGDLPGTDVRFFKDKQEHVRADAPQESVWAHSVHRTEFSEEDLEFLRQSKAQLSREAKGEIPPESMGVITFADVTHCAHANIPDAFDFARIRSIINYNKYGITPVMPIVATAGPLVKFFLGLFPPQYCEASQKVSQHTPPDYTGIVIGLRGSKHQSGFNLLIPEERKQILRHMDALKKFAKLPLSQMPTADQVEQMLAEDPLEEDEGVVEIPGDAKVRKMLESKVKEILEES